VELSKKMIRLSQIAYYLALAVLLHLLSALAPAMAQNVARTGETSTLSVEQQPGDVYSWELYKESTNPNFNFVTEPGETLPSYAEFVDGIRTGTTVNVLWKEPGIYFYKVKALNITGCTNNIKIGMIEVKLGVSAEIEASPVVCAGETISLTVTLAGTPPWEFTYNSWDGTTTQTVTVVNVLTSPHVVTLTPGPVITTEYWITTVKDKYGINTTPSVKTTQQINPLPASSIIYHR
jgi:hypothetical protein